MTTNSNEELVNKLVAQGFNKPLVSSISESVEFKYLLVWLLDEDVAYGVKLEKLVRFLKFNINSNLSIKEKLQTYTELGQILESLQDDVYTYSEEENMFNVFKKYKFTTLENFFDNLKKEGTEYGM